MRLIVTRPEPDATLTARVLIRLGHEAILSPMLDIVSDPRAALPREEPQAVLVTSGNAVRALAGHRERERLNASPLLAVGDATALQAKRAGFADVRSAGGALDDLVRLVETTLAPGGGPLLYAAGETRSGDLAGRLAALGFMVETVVTYRAEPRARLAGVAETALGARAADGVLLYSRRSAAAFALALRAAGLAPLDAGVICYCLSEAVAEPVAAVAGGPVLIAARPDQIGLFALIEVESARRRGGPPTGDLTGDAPA